MWGKGDNNKKAPTSKRGLMLSEVEILIRLPQERDCRYACHCSSHGLIDKNG